MESSENLRLSLNLTSLTLHSSERLHIQTSLAYLFIYTKEVPRILKYFEKTLDKKEYLTIK